MKQQRKLTADLVRQIRIDGLADTEWARRLDVPVKTVRNARVGSTWSRITTPPDIRLRNGDGRGQNPIAKLAREHQDQLDDFPVTTKGITL